MERTKIAPEYSEQYLEIDRPQTLSDNRIETLISDILHGRTDKDISDKVYKDFTELAKDHILNNPVNNLIGLESYGRVDICNGCTQFIDTLYMNHGTLQVIQGDYRYHNRLNPELIYSVPGNLIPKKPLVIALPFPSLGSVHPQMKEILDECLDKEIDVHIDGAWLSCSHGINWDFSHLAIRSVAYSLSKGYGLGWNRVALRHSRLAKPDAITIMNDFHMNNRALFLISNHLLRNLPKNYLWDTHGDNYYKVCNDFNLQATQSIHIAMRNNQPVGVAPLLRYMENNGI